MIFYPKSYFKNILEIDMNFIEKNNITITGNTKSAFFIPKDIIINIIHIIKGIIIFAITFPFNIFLTLTVVVYIIFPPYFISKMILITLFKLYIKLLVIK